MLFVKRVICQVEFLIERRLRLDDIPFRKVDSATRDTSHQLRLTITDKSSMTGFCQLRITVLPLPSLLRWATNSQSSRVQSFKWKCFPPLFPTKKISTLYKLFVSKPPPMKWRFGARHVTWLALPLDRMITIFNYKCDSPRFNLNRASVSENVWSSRSERSLYE